MRRRLAILLVAALCAAGSAAAAAGRAGSDPMAGDEWWLADVGATQATPPGPGVPITIVDSGVDATNPEFAGRPNTTYLDTQTVDGRDEYHGTAVASVAAAPENGVGIVGVYPQAVLQSFDATQFARLFSDQNAIAGILAASQHCPGVINLSFGGGRDPELDAAILKAFHAGCLVVAAAGNGGEQGSPITYPAAYPHVLTVGASDQNDQVVTFSTISPTTDIVAPGVAITGAVPASEDPSFYEKDLAGTSFAAPIVTAAAAWIWTMRPDLDVTQLFNVIRSSARDIGPSGFDNASGFGLLNIPAALAAPAPPRDPMEPNDDVDEVKPGRLFAAGDPPLTSPAKVSNRITGTLDESEDPHDLYRIWVPAARVVRVSATGDGSATARIWAPGTVSIDEGLTARRRDLKGQVVRGGKAGAYAYVDVLLTARSRSSSYLLSVTVSKR